MNRGWVPGERLAGRSARAAWDTDGDGPRIGVLALQGDVLEHLRVLSQVGARPSRVRRLEHLEQLDGLVLPGGESTTIGKLLGLTGMLEPLRERIAGGFPVFGTCAGMILLADRLRQDFDQPLLGGLGVEVERNAFGRQVDSFDTTLDVDGIGEVDASFIRAPRVTEVLADDVRVLASVGEHPVVVERGALLASAFHPEITGDVRLHEHFVVAVAGRGAGTDEAQPARSSTHST